MGDTSSPSVDAPHTPTSPQCQGPQVNGEASLELDEQGESPANKMVTFSDAVGTRELPAVDLHCHIPNDQEDANKALERHRLIFRAEMHRLNAELEAFKTQCRLEMIRQAREVEQQKAAVQGELDQVQRQLLVKKSLRDVKHDIDDLASEQDMLKRRQSVIDQQAEVIGKEEELAQKLKGLEDYEKEVQDIERYLDRRLDQAKEKENDIMAINEELQRLQADLDSQKDTLERGQSSINTDQEVHTTEKSPHEKPTQQSEQQTRVKENWEFLQKSLMQKQTTLEAALRRCKSELATSENLSDELTIRVSRLEEELRQKDRKMKKLETQLSLTIGQVVATQDGEQSTSSSKNPYLCVSSETPQASLVGSTMTLRSTQSAQPSVFRTATGETLRPSRRTSSAGLRRKPSNLHKPTWPSGDDSVAHNRSRSAKDKSATLLAPYRRYHSDGGSQEHISVTTEKTTIDKAKRPSQTCQIM